MRILVLLIFFFFLFSDEVFAAVSISVSNVPGSVNPDQEFTADIILTCTNCGTSYLRGVFFYPEDSHTYLGYTQNNAGDWIATSSDKTLYFKTEEGSWSGQVKFKFDLEKSPGGYFFKVGRYTSASDKSADYSSPVAISVIAPATPTETTAPTPSPSPTPSPTPTKTPTSTPTPTKTPTPTSTLTVKPTPTTKPLPSPSSDIKRSDLLIPTASVASEILGVGVSATPSQEMVTPAVEAQTVEKDFRQTDTFTAIAVGITSIGLLGVIFYRLSKISIKERIK